LAIPTHPKTNPKGERGKKTNPIKLKTSPAKAALERGGVAGDWVEAEGSDGFAGRASKGP
jgi:hypothetical protein